MTVDLVQIPQPGSLTHSMLADVKPEDIIKTGTMRFVGQHETATRLFTSVQIGEARQSINWEHPEWKTAMKIHTSFFGRQREIHHHFQITKMQGKTEYMAYIRYLAVELCKRLGIYDQMSKLSIEYIDYIEWPTQ